MNKLHFLKNLGVMVGMISTMLAIATISIDLYIFLIAGIAGMAVGRVLFNWSFKRWPLYPKDTK